jgi:hypothetical protein
VTISAIAVAQAKAAAAHARATDWHARTAALETELQPGAVAVLVMLVCCVVMLMPR